MKYIVVCYNGALRDAAATNKPEGRKTPHHPGWDTVFGPLTTLRAAYAEQRELDASCDYPHVVVPLTEPHA